MRRRRLRRIRNRRAFLVIVGCAGVMSPIAAQAADPSAPAAAVSIQPPGGLVVALAPGDSAMQAGVLRGDEVVLARGLEVDLARLVARRLGSRIDRFVQVRPAGRLLAGTPPRWQLALAALEPSHVTRSGVDLSTPYLTTDVAVVLRRGLPRPRRLADLRGRVLCALRGSESAHVIGATVRPKRRPLLAPGRERLRSLVRTGACDAAFVPAIEAGRFVRGHARQLGPVAGRIEHGAGLVAAVAPASGLTAAVDRELRRLRSEGTLGRLARRWLGLDPAALRILR